MNVIQFAQKRFFRSLMLTVVMIGSGTGTVSSQESRVAVYPAFEDLVPLFNNSNDTTYVVNFWATWCKPCVKELPFFEAAVQAYKGHPVKIILVSLDFPKQVDSRLMPFIREHDLQAEVVVLTDPDANSWIPKIADEWSGAIPATMAQHQGKKVFREGDFESLKDLQDFIEKCNK